VTLAKKDVLEMESLSVEEIEAILDTAETLKEISTRPIKKVPTLRGKTIVHFFYEPSTRTKISFEIAAKRLSADTVSISASTSSIVKGETLVDTAKNLEAMNPDAIVIRHSAAGAPHLLARLVEASVINAGDGMHAHPTQALLDMMTVREKKGRLAGLRIAIIGDIAHSRVARSNIVGLNKTGAEVILAGPPTMIPMGVETLGVHVTYHVEEAIKDADIVMSIRIQKERLEKGQIPKHLLAFRISGHGRDWCRRRPRRAQAIRDNREPAATPRSSGQGHHDAPPGSNVSLGADDHSGLL